MDRYGIVHKQLDAYRSESRGIRSPRTVFGRLVCEKETRAVNRQSRHDVSIAEPPQYRCPKRPYVEFNRSIPVANRQHRRDLRSHHVHLDTESMNASEGAPPNVAPFATLEPALERSRRGGEFGLG